MRCPHTGRCRRCLARASPSPTVQSNRPPRPPHRRARRRATTSPHRRSRSTVRCSPASAQKWVRAESAAGYARSIHPAPSDPAKPSASTQPRWPDAPKDGMKLQSLLFLILAITIPCPGDSDETSRLQRPCSFLKDRQRARSIPARKWNAMPPPECDSTPANEWSFQKKFTKLCAAAGSKAQ